MPGRRSALPRLEGWIPVELFASADPASNTFQFPQDSIFLNGAALPKWLLVRRPSQGDTRGPTRVVRTRVGDGASDLAVKANRQLLVDLGVDMDVPYPPAEVSGASHRARLRHDRGYQVSTLAIAVAFAGGAFAIVDAATDSTWSKVVVAALALAAFVGQQFVRSA